MRILTDVERSLIANALRLAQQQYAKDAEECRTGLATFAEEERRRSAARLAEQFDRQAEMADDLAGEFEAVLTVRLGTND